MPGSAELPVRRELGRLLLDTHVFLWWLAGDRRLGRRARAWLADERVDVYVSAASAWEITTKARLGKLPGAELVARDVGAAVASQGFLELPIRLAHAERAGAFVHAHRDPFDRVLAAQSILEELPIVSADAALDAFGVRRLI